MRIFNDFGLTKTYGASRLWHLTNMERTLESIKEKASISELALIEMIERLSEQKADKKYGQKISELEKTNSELQEERKWFKFFESNLLFWIKMNPDFQNPLGHQILRWKEQYKKQNQNANTD